MVGKVGLETLPCASYTVGNRVCIFFFVPFVVKGICTWAVEKLWFTFELFTHTLAFRSVQCVEFYRFEDYYTKLLPLLR